MTELLERGILAVRSLPAERQDRAGEILLVVAEQALRHPGLTAAQLAEVDRAINEADRGIYASDEEMEAIWRGNG